MPIITTLKSPLLTRLQAVSDAFGNRECANGINRLIARSTSFRLLLIAHSPLELCARHSRVVDSRCGQKRAQRDQTVRFSFAAPARYRELLAQSFLLALRPLLPPMKPINRQMNARSTQLISDGS